MDENTDQTEPRGGRFVTGGKPGPGRPKGSRNKLGEEFVRALHDSFKLRGVEAIDRVVTDEPGKYLTIIANVIPKEIDLGEELNEAVKEIILRGVRSDAHY